MKRVVALVAAAGESSRMQQPKALLQVEQADGDHQPLAAHLGRVLLAGGASDVIVTLPEPPDDATVLLGLRPHLRGATFTRNQTPAEGLLGSVRTALSIIAAVDRDLGAGDDEGSAEAVEALVFSPVDAPHTCPKLVRALLDALTATKADAVIPTVDGRQGHPVVVASSFFAAFEAPSDTGPRGILAGAQVHEMTWHDPQVCANVNTPSEWKNARDDVSRVARSF